MVSRISGSGSYFFMYRYEFSGVGSSVRRTGQQASGGAPVQSAPAANGSIRPTGNTGASPSNGSVWPMGSTGVSASYNSFQAAGGLNGNSSAVPFTNAAGWGAGEDTIPDLFIRKGADPAEYAVRMRMQYAEPSGADLPGQDEAVEGTQNASGLSGEEECKTCEQRKYQDGSNDMGVSFKTPTRIAPEAAGAMVRSHEQEHVTRERAKAEREDREVISQSVTLHTDICPECGKVYISGGTTQTTTASRPEPVGNTEPDEVQRRPFSAVA